MHDWLHLLIDYQNVSIVNFSRGQKVVQAGWLLSADRPEISLNKSGVCLACVLAQIGQLIIKSRISKGLFITGHSLIIVSDNILF